MAIPSDHTTRRDSSGEAGQGGPTATRHDGNATRHEAGAESGQDVPSDGWLGLPPDIAQHYQIQRRLHISSESEVFLLETVALGTGASRKAVFKRYLPMIEPKENILERIRRLSTSEEGRQWLVELLEYGSWEGSSFELQTFYPLGTLREALKASASLNPHYVARQLGPAILYIHGEEVVHGDLKPENILIAGFEPLALRLCDFGTAREIGETGVHYTKVGFTTAYMPPEGCNRHGSPRTDQWDWWSFGVMMAELSTGHHPFALPGGKLPNEEVLEDLLTRGAVELDDITDDRLSLLCRGCLVQDRDRRWGDEEIHAWLRGDSPDVASTTQPHTARRGAKRHTVYFDGQEFDDPDALAGGFQEHWSYALEKLFQAPDDGLRSELSDLLNEHGLEDAVRALSSQVATPDKAPWQFARLLREMSPERLQPAYNGLVLDERSLHAAAAQIIQGKAKKPEIQRLNEVRQLGILKEWRSLPTSMGDAAELEEQWQRGCAVLGEVLEDVQNEIDLRPQRTLAEAWVLLVLLDPQGQLSDLRSRLTRSSRRSVSHAPWWLTLEAQSASLDHALSSDPASPDQYVASLLGKVAISIVAVLAYPAAREASVREQRRQELRRRQALAPRLRTVWGITRPFHWFLPPVATLFLIFSRTNWLVGQAWGSQPWWFNMYVKWYATRVGPLRVWSTNTLVANNDASLAAAVAVCVTVVVLCCDRFIASRPSEYIRPWMLGVSIIGFAAGVVAAWVYLPWLIAGFAFGVGGSLAAVGCFVLVNLVARWVAGVLISPINRRLPRRPLNTPES
jgi:serine/threonine protein kinase